MSGITGESVKSAVGAALAERFPGVPWYREAVSRPGYPHFFVQVINAAVERDTPGRWWLDYLVNIRYRAAGEPRADKGVSEALDEMGIALLECTETVTIGGRPCRTRDARLEKADGVLQFFLSLRLRAGREEISSPPVFGELVQHIGLKE